MNGSRLLCGGLMVLLAVAGCERGKRTEEPAPYHRDVDAPPTALILRADEGLMADQRRISGEVEGRPSGGVGRATGAESVRSEVPATEADVEVVKAVVEKMIAAAEDDDTNALVGFFSREDAVLVRPMFEADKTMPAKLDALGALVSEKLSVELPAGMKRGMGSKIAPTGMLTSVEPDEFKYSLEGPSVVVTNPSDKRALPFVKIGRQWLVQYSEQGRKGLSFVSDVAAATGEFISAMTAGVNDGSITAENLEAKAKELAEKHIRPAAEKLGALMTEAMGAAVPAEDSEEPVPAEDTGGTEPTEETGEAEPVEPAEDSGDEGAGGP